MNQDDREILLQKYTEANNRLKAVTQRLNEAEEKLKEYERKAEEALKASRMKSLFLANMSHEIRTPLNAVEGFARIMAETDSQEERMNYMEIIDSNNARLQSLINEILDLSRVESGEIAIKRAPTDLNQLMASIKMLFKFRVADSVALNWNKPMMPVIMHTDENRITQVFSNLISNALKHTPRGSITYGYEINGEEQTIRFYVADTGSGIDPKFIGHIFDLYASRDAEEHKGYGLGLALCRIIVEKMGGRISVESKLGEGSTFSFVLPFEGTIGGMSPIRTTTNVRTVRVDSTDQSHTKTILVAEDEESNYELVRIVLQKRYRLIRAHNGIEAVTLNDEEMPDLILMDIRMPQMDGLDATKIIKEVRPEVPVIALSAYAYDENINEAKAAGCTEFLAKPFKVEHLIEIVQKYID